MRYTVAFILVALFLFLAAGSVAATGAWGQINQEVEKPEGWRRFVEGSAFWLGEPTVVGDMNGKPLYEVPYGTYPSIDGSTIAVPMVMEFARQHLNVPEEDLEGFVFLSTTHTAYEHLIRKLPNGAAIIGSMNATMEENKPVDLFIGTEPSADELALAAEYGVELLKEPIAYDAFVFITHAENPVDNLTAEQIQGIYSGKYISWKEVGGPDEPIYAYQREQNSGSQTAMETMVMQGKPMDGAQSNEIIVHEMSGLIERVGQYENRNNSIGFTYKYYIDTLYQSDSIKILSIDGVYPTPENLRNGTYPYTALYYGVIRREDELNAGGKFLRWMKSVEGQRSIQQAGYIPYAEVE